MSRPPREFKPLSFELEGRLLMATAPTPVNPNAVEFGGNITGAVGFQPIQVVTQQAGEATVTLSRQVTAGSQQVVVTGFSSSPNDAGVNVGAGIDLRLMSWGDGTGVPTSGTSLVIVGTDTAGLLHIRNFDAYGNRVTDADETQPLGTQAGGISALKQQLPGLLPPHMLTGAEEAQILQEVTSIVGHAPLGGSQTVTFADGQSQATLTVPILAGAPNPGVVDVNLYAYPINPPTPTPGSPYIPTTPLALLDLKIVASDPTLPPKVVSVVGTSHRFVLSFNQPMDPVSASNVKNYAVSWVSKSSEPTGGVNLLGVVFGATGTRTTVSRDSVRLKSAQYDPATQTVTLIAKQRHLNLGFLDTIAQVHRGKTSVRHHRDVAPGITDLDGNPVNADTTPGKIELRVHPFTI